MFKPARMSRVLVSGHRDRMEDVIDTLHQEGVVHLEDYRDPTGITAIGTPLDAGDHVSELLLRVRGLQKALDVEDTPARALAVDDPAPMVAEAETAILDVVGGANEVRARMAALENERAQLAPLRGVEIDLAALVSLESVHVFLGTVVADPTRALDGTGIPHETTLGETGAGRTALVVVRAEHRALAEAALVSVGYSPVPIPAGVVGTPAAATAAIDVSLTEATGEMAGFDAELAQLRDVWAGKLASLEALLAGAAQRTQAPLQFGVTERTFHLEGWVPRGHLNHLHNVLSHRFGDSLFVEDLGDAPMEPVGAAGGGHDQHTEHHEVSADDEAPTALRNKGPVQSYEFLLSLLALPRYKELDPTKLIAFFFPLFFGLMVGDVALGLLIMGIALWLRKGNIFGIGGPGVAKPMFWGGLWALIIGLFIFGEALGLHFVVAEDSGEHSWETVFDFEFPEEGFIHKAEPHGSGHAMDADHAADNDGLHPLAEDTTHQGGVFEPHGAPHLSVNGWFNLGLYSKIHDVEALLLISVIIGLVHITLGLLLGVRNIYVGHGLKLAVQEKVSWLLIMASTAAIVLGIQGDLSALTWGGAAVLVAAVALLWMGVQHTLGVGFVAILEIPSLLGNLLSYTRLAAIGASKAGMAIAFATIGFELIGGVFGLIVYLLASLLILVLAILAGFLQSLRLQFVEFFSKFYEGGGRPYVPFGRRAPRPPSSP